MYHLHLQNFKGMIYPKFFLYFMQPGIYWTKYSKFEREKRKHFQYVIITLYATNSQMRLINTVTDAANFNKFQRELWALYDEESMHTNTHISRNKIT